MNSILLPDEAAQREFVALFSAAFDATIAVILSELRAGRRPPRGRTIPVLSVHDNGMPYLRDTSSWDARGPLDYAELLDREGGKVPCPARFEAGRLAEVDAVIDFVRTHPGLVRAYAPEQDPEAQNSKFTDLTRIQVELHLSFAANRYFHRFGKVSCNDRKRDAILRPFVRGLFAERLEVANVVPIALVKFDFDRLRLASDIYIVRMSDALHRARWSVKALGATGHDSVVSAATHAFVINGWLWPNLPWIQMTQNMGAQAPELRNLIEQLFAALRLVTGVSTGYAQEVRVPRRWTRFLTDALPEVVAAGARRYPEEFDDFGWTREVVPTITRQEMREVGAVFDHIRSSEEPRFDLALRRMSSAMMRTDVADAILDTTIALEILLGDGDGQAIGYKLRLRAGALANLDEPGTAASVVKLLTQLYDIRSRIVHGARGRRARDHSASDANISREALETLRRIMMILLIRPRFLDPHKIDAELLLG